MYGKQFPRIRKPLGERVANALKRRIGPGQAVTVKQLVNATGIGETTIWSLLSGNRDPRGSTLDELIDFFDSSFMQEIYGESHGCVIAKISDRRAADAIRRLNQARADLIEATGGREP